MAARMPRFSRAERLALVRTALNLLSRWSATEDQARAILGGLSSSAYGAWNRGDVGNLTSDQAYRLVLLLQIHKALRIRFNCTERAYGWMYRPNAIFVGQSPMELIADGELAEIERVLAFLAADL